MPAGRVRSPAAITVISIDLLDTYARYQANSKEHAWPCGSLLPNDLGLFDMLGNVYEWCQDRMHRFQPAKKGIHNDDINISESINEKNPRLLRGGAFDIFRRSSARRTVTGIAPSYRSILQRFPPRQDLPLIYFTSLPLPPF